MVGFPPTIKQNDVGLLTTGIFTHTAAILKCCDYMGGGESGLINLAAWVGTKTIISRARKKGSINIHFTNDQDLERIIELILNEN